MDPLLDEKIVLTLLRSIPEFLQANLFIHAEKEAYGPSINEGLCFESCSSISFDGDANGIIYLCLDGYTKLRLLPRIANHFKVDLRGMADSVMLEFGNQMASTIVGELMQGGFDVQLGPPENLNHKIVPIDLKRYRQYILIFFMKDRREKQYLGRTYIVLTMQKF